MDQDYAGAQQGAMKPELKETITNLGLEYRLMTQFTSFVAVEEMIVTDGGQPRRIDVPVEVPEGVNREAVFGGERGAAQTGSTSYMLLQSAATLTKDRKSQRSPKSSGQGRNVGGGGPAGGSGGGVAGGTGRGSSPKPMASVAETVSVTAAADGIDENGALKKLSPEEERRQRLASKVDPAILAVIDRLKARKTLPELGEARFVHNGKAEIQVWLVDKSEQTINKLKELGFEVVLDPKSAKMIIGRVPLEKLEALAKLQFVRYVTPQVAGN
jgi:Ca-activated chloride channel family protein